MPSQNLGALDVSIVIIVDFISPAPTSEALFFIDLFEQTSAGRRAGVLLNSDAKIPEGGDQQRPVFCRTLRSFLLRFC